MDREQISDDWAPVFGRMGTVDLRREPEEVEPMVEVLRLFLGYAGWGPGQLEGELRLGAWIVADASTDDVFAAEPKDLWRTVLARQRGTTSWMAHFPDDPSMN
jgi:putative transcriptional regulator